MVCLVFTSHEEEDEQLGVHEVMRLILFHFVFFSFILVFYFYILLVSIVLQDEDHEWSD